MLRSLAFALVLVAGGAHASDKPANKAVAKTPATASPVIASDGWIRVLPGTLPAGGFVTFENTSDRALSIVSADSADYGDVMIHRSSTEGGMGRMEMVDNVPLPAKQKTSFSPGGYHVMLMDAKHPVKAGDTLTVTFKLSDGEAVPVKMLARPANATGPHD